MPSIRTLTAAAVAVALAAPAAAAAAPPPNDNYLASATIDPASATFEREFRQSIDTTEATTQADTFNPNREGVPFGGGDPEPTTCAAGAPPYGKTAWWDFRPPFPGGVQIKANGGHDVVVAVYEWSAQTSKITRTVTCQNDSLGSEDVVLPEVRKGTNYTIQVGGAGDTGGPLEFALAYFPDRDDDGRFDADDKCVRRQGTASGCPPELRATPRIRYQGVPGGIRITSLAIDDVPKGARAEVRGAGAQDHQEGEARRRPVAAGRRRPHGPRAAARSRSASRSGARARAASGSARPASTTAGRSRRRASATASSGA